MNKVEIIPFNLFMNQTWQQKKLIPLNRKKLVYSFISPAIFFDGGTLLLIGAGVVAVGFTIYERHALSEGDTAKADTISLIGNVLLQGGGIALAVYLLSTMPILHWL